MSFVYFPAYPSVTAGGVSLSQVTALLIPKIEAASSDILTNKTINGPTNIVAADKLETATLNAYVDVAAAAVPIAGQVLKTSGPTAATWQTLAYTDISGNLDNITDGVTYKKITAVKETAYDALVTSEPLNLLTDGTRTMTNRLRLYDGQQGVLPIAALKMHTSYKVNMNLEYNAGNSVALIDTAALNLATQRVDFIGAVPRYTRYAAGNNIPADLSIGCLRVGYAPFYNSVGVGVPENHQIYRIWNGTNNNGGFIMEILRNANNPGQIRCRSRRSGGTAIYTLLGNIPFHMVPGTVYDIEWNTNVISGLNELFFQGVRIDISTSTGIRDNNDSLFIDIGRVISTLSDYALDYVSLFDTVQHSGASYIPSPPEYSGVTLSEAFSGQLNTGVLRELDAPDLVGQAETYSIFTASAGFPVKGLSVTGTTVELLHDLQMHAKAIINASSYNGYTPADNAALPNYLLRNGTSFMTGDLNLSGFRIDATSELRAIAPLIINNLNALTSVLQLSSNSIVEYDFDATRLDMRGNNLLNVGTYNGYTPADNAALANYVPLAGGNMSGDLTMSKINPLMQLTAAATSLSAVFRALNSATIGFRDLLDAAVVETSGTHFSDSIAGDSIIQARNEIIADSKRLLLGSGATSSVRIEEGIIEVDIPVMRTVGVSGGYSTIITPTGVDVVGDLRMNTRLLNDIGKCVSYRQTGVQTINSVTVTPMQFPFIKFNDDTTLYTVSGPGNDTFTINRAGLYMLNCEITYDPTSQGGSFRQSWFSHSNPGNDDRYSLVAEMPIPTAFKSYPMVHTARFIAGEFVKVQINHNAGIPINYGNFLSGIPPLYCDFSITCLGP